MRANACFTLAFVSLNKDTRLTDKRQCLQHTRQVFCASGLTFEMNRGRIEVRFPLLHSFDMAIPPPPFSSLLNLEDVQRMSD